MANTVDIEVHLKGTEAAKKGLGSLGESAGKLAGKFDQTNSHLGEGISQLTGNIDELGGSFLELGSTIGQVGRTGGASFAMLIPAIGGVVAAGITLYETFQLISGAAQQAEDSQEAMAAASADLQGKLEALAEKGVIPTTEELKKFAKANFAAQLAKERQQKVFEKSTKIENKALALTRKIVDLEKEKAKALAVIEDAKRTGGIFDARELAMKGAINHIDRQLVQTKLALAKAQRQYNIEIEKALPAQTQTQEKLKNTEAQYKKLEDQSAESTLARVKESAARLDALKLADAEAKMTGTALDLQKTHIEESKEALAIRIEEVKTDAAALKAIESKLNAELKGFDQRKVMEQKFAAQRVAIYEKQNAELEAIDKARAAKVKARRQQRLIEGHQIRLLEIEQLRLQGADELEVLEQREKAELELAGRNSNRRLMIEMKYQNQRLRLQQAADAKAEAESQRLEDHRRNFMLESQAFDISMMEEGQDKELNLLELKYRRMREMKGRSEEEMTELTRRFNLERQAIEDRSINAQIDKIAELTRSYGAGFAEAAYASVFFGESFLESSAQVLQGLGRQAAVEALVNTAKGIAASVLNPAAAGAHFAAASAFGVAAAAAAVGSKALGGGGGGGGGGASAPTSPTGSPQIAPETERERAESSQMVFNINFGGAVVYDTKQAAEQALADRITSLQNMNRRGAPRRRS